MLEASEAFDAQTATTPRIDGPARGLVPQRHPERVIVIFLPRCGRRTVGRQSSSRRRLRCTSIDT